MSAETTVSGARPAAKLPIYILPCFLWIGIIPTMPPPRPA